MRNLSLRVIIIARTAKGVGKVVAMAREVETAARRAPRVAGGGGIGVV